MLVPTLIIDLAKDRYIGAINRLIDAHASGPLHATASWIVNRPFILTVGGAAVFVVALIVHATVVSKSNAEPTVVTPPTVPQSEKPLPAQLDGRGAAEHMPVPLLDSGIGRLLDKLEERSDRYATRPRIVVGVNKQVLPGSLMEDFAFGIINIGGRAARDIRVTVPEASHWRVEFGRVPVLQEGKNIPLDVDVVLGESHRHGIYNGLVYWASAHSDVAGKPIDGLEIPLEVRCLDLDDAQLTERMKIQVSARNGNFALSIVPDLASPTDKGIQQPTLVQVNAAVLSR